MVAKLEGPQFSGGANIAIKCPSHTYEATVRFYRDTLGLPLIEEEDEGCIFQFGPNRLWVDRVPNLSHPDIWLELETNDTEAAASSATDLPAIRASQLLSLGGLRLLAQFIADLRQQGRFPGSS